MAKLKQKTKWVWCQRKELHLDWLGWNLKGNIKLKTVPKHIRCPECGRRFERIIRECHDAGCMHLYLPAHKKKVKVKP